MSAPCPSFGFIVTLELASSVTDDQADALIDDFLEVLDRNGLATAGGGRGRSLEFVVRREGSQATHADRELVLGWVPRWSDRAAVVVGDIIDLSP